MSRTIKTKDSVKGVKVLHRSVNTSDQMKDAFIKIKDKAEHGLYSDDNSPSQYATDNVTHATEKAGRKAVNAFDKQGRKAVDTTKENISKARDKARAFKERKAADPPKERAVKRSQDDVRRGTHTVRKTNEQSVEATERGGKVAKKSAKAMKSTAKGTVKTAPKSAKTAEQTAKMTIKTTQQAAKAAPKTAQATVKGSQKAVQVARATAKATVTAAKAAVKATVAMVKAMIAATKALVSAIIAGGWVAVTVILIICLIGLLVGSVFGIFFSGEDSGTGQTMQTVVREINEDYNTELDSIKAENPHDVLEMSGSRAVWKEVLAVYAVKTVTDPDNPQEVATMDSNKKVLLTNIFWEMNEISSRTETKTETVIETSDDGNGNIVETEVTVTQAYLYITISHKTAEEIANQYGFNADQRKQLAELLADENNALWSAVLYGISYGDGEIVSVALSQVGNVGGEAYWSWYGFDSRVEWCACFVSWCANECGYIEAGIIPKFAGCQSQGIPWFQERGQWQNGSYTSNPGDIIFFDWEGDGSSDHVGIVERVESDRVYTIEGNSGDACKQRDYAIGSSVIFGYGIPAY